MTVTLPESTLARLATIDPDRAHAIVKATNAALPLDRKNGRPVELVNITPGLGILLVAPSRYLRQIEWLRLVEVAPTRFLLVLPSGTSVDSLEVAITDLLEGEQIKDPWDRMIVEDLRKLIRQLRRENRFSKAELLFIDTRNPEPA